MSLLQSPLRKPLRRLSALGLLSVLGAALTALCVQAQIFTGSAPNQVVAMPGESAPEPKMPVAQLSAATPILRFMPSTLDGFKLSGEIGDLRWPIYLSATQAESPLRFRIGYVSAVSILPEASTLEVKINDQTIGTETIDAPQSTRIVEFPVPFGLTQRGYNSVSVSVQQRHRVDCSVAATYELWTKIDPAETGFVLPGDSGGIRDLSDLPALLPKADGTLPIHILLAGKTNPAHLSRLILATEQLALVGRFLQPAVDFSSAGADPFGVNLAVGTRATLARVPEIAGSLGDAGPMLKVLASRTGKRPTILVTGSSDADLDRAIAALGEVMPASGTPSGLLAAVNYPAFRTEGGEALPVRSLGVHSQDFNGRFFRKSFNFNLPSDFLASDYGRGTFDLAGGYSANLARGAQVRVDLNGRNAGNIELPYKNGDVFRHNQLFLPLSLMRPGLNRIDVFAETAKLEDAACAASDEKRFLFLDRTEIVLPTLARVERFPDLSLTTSGGLPFADGKARLVVPKPDRDATAAALSLVARAAVSARKLIPFEFATKVSSDDDVSNLVVSPAQALDPAFMSATGLSPSAVEAAWRDLSLPSGTNDAAVAVSRSRWWATNTNGPLACRVPAPVNVKLPTAAKRETAKRETANSETVQNETGKSEPGKAEPGNIESPNAAEARARSPETDDLLVSWTEEARTSGWKRRLATTFKAAKAWFADLKAPKWRPIASTNENDGITASASLILAQGMASGSSQSITTIVTAPDSATLRASIACLADPQVWAKVRGRLAILEASSGDITTTDAKSFRYVSSVNASLANSRLILAGWFSLNPTIFVILSLLTALCLSGTTLWFVRGVGRRPE